MKLSPAFFAPLMLIASAAGAIEARNLSAEAAVSQSERPVARLDEASLEHPASGVASSWRTEFLQRDFVPDSARQVRIERRMTIRITPRNAPVRPDMFAELPDREIEPRYIERRIGKCLPVAGIAGVQANGGKNIILFMRDRRIVSADLERACHARDFYSGFYLSPSSDGRLCVDRDALQSRSGANCKLERIRQLVEVGR